MTVISKPYMKLQSQLHLDNAAYGASGHYHVGWVTRALAKYSGHSILDYGAGKQTLKNALPPGVEYRAYDPAFEETRKPPVQADVTACLDVLEHIEPQYLRDVITDLWRVTKLASVMTISTRPASKILADGRNAHLIVQPTIWWLMQLDARFNIQHYENHDRFFYVEATPR